MASWTTEESSAMDKCGHCDNCTRPADTVFHKDATLEAWQVLKIAQTVDTEGGRQTIAALSDLARGGAGGSFEAGGKRRMDKEKVQLDYNAIAGGKVALSKDVSHPTLSFISLFGHSITPLYLHFAVPFHCCPGLTLRARCLWVFLGARNAHCALTHLAVPRRSVLVHRVQRQRIRRPGRTSPSAYPVRPRGHPRWSGPANPLFLQTESAEIFVDRRHRGQEAKTTGQAQDRGAGRTHANSGGPVTAAPPAGDGVRKAETTVRVRRGVRGGRGGRD